MVDNKHQKNNNQDPTYAASRGPDSAAPVVWANKKTLSPTKWTVVVIASVLLVVAASALFIFRDTEEKPSVEVDTVQVETDAHELEEQGKYKQAIAAYDVAVDNTEGEEKAAFITAQAQISLRANDLEHALKYAIEADIVHSGVETQSLVGAIAKQKGDNNLAVEYYEKALESYKNQEIREEPEEQAIQRILDELRAAE